jgi:hypothetical protein
MHVRGQKHLWANSQYFNSLQSAFQRLAHSIVGYITQCGDYPIANPGFATEP